MTDLLLLGQDASRTQELARIFQNAGYQVIEMKDAVACCRHLQSELSRAQQYIPIQAPVPEEKTGQTRGVTIFNPAAGKDAPQHRPQLLASILSLARQLNPGWRLSMRYRRLDCPSGAGAQLTTLEFNFIKIFATVEIGEVVSRKQIVQSFGEDYLSYDQNRIDTMVRRLRQKIENSMGMKLPLNTERVRGYSFGDLLIIDP
ncbi:helix-turn-helix domain-containing protein [Massilia endophytica]|uniref:helix-turn-helix domain-containing protein n=1 Tax=Massilia endophytica TaxID=2899220 RepID=UPI001E518AB1|nr:helix-turn-helix domain-containing protein [Massilia endophytica]UGQ48926.1 helix-turn-helix domain-containing protein [Massilia endophytica]